MTLRVVPIDDIPDEGLVLDEPLERAWLDEALRDTGYHVDPAATGAPGRATLRLDRQKSDVILSGTARARLETQCVRCLSALTQAVSVEFTLNLEPLPTREPRARDEVELTADELDVDYYEHDRIDVPRWVREQLLLEAPAYPRCEQPCALPGATSTQSEPASTDAAKAIDPRLAPLQKFQATKKE